MQVEVEKGQRGRKSAWKARMRLLVAHSAQQINTAQVASKCIVDHEREAAGWLGSR
jgi:hypothetical protein